ncbi:MAG: 5'/3'-nucleotidase SurE [Thermotogaceae bacterium]|nr:5'/3'-nucleotidase SurE [Thermotogaceae bacterium]
MRILITNDDGVTSEGILTLAKTLAKKHEVMVVAPESERSAVGHAITIHLPIWAEKLSIFEDIPVYSTTGTPADCVKLGIDVLFPNPDVVISGINQGPNLGTDVIYSGTVSGALEGTLYGIPSIAVSSANYLNPNYKTAAKAIYDLLEQFDLSIIPQYTALNINVPAVPYEELRGWKVTRQSKRRWKDYFEARTDPFGRTYYWMKGDVIEDDKDPDADYKAVNQNYISVTPVSIFITEENFFKELKKALSTLE